MFPSKDVIQSCVVGVAVFLMTLLFGYLLLPRIRKRSAGQQVRDDGPRTHYGKSGTPTFGGLFFLIPIFLVALVLFFTKANMRDMFATVIFMGLFGLVGFIDDYTKVHISKDGLSVRQKTLVLGLISIAAALYTTSFSSMGPFILLPFSIHVIPVTGNWKILYAVLMAIFLFFIGNAANITDGLDGLLSSLMAVASLGLFFTFGLLSAVAENASSFMVLSLAICGGTLGFLVFNHYPAKVFMGDTGSLALGAGFAMMICLSGMPWLALLTGAVFVVEGLSVVVQVLYFKATKGKRILKMAPLHHHFECSGWPETKVVRRFVVAGAVGAAVGVLFSLGDVLK